MISLSLYKILQWAQRALTYVWLVSDAQFWVKILVKTGNKQNRQKWVKISLRKTKMKEQPDEYQLIINKKN